MSIDVDREMRRIRRLLDLIAREHHTRAPTDLTLAALLEFLAEIGESPAEFFTITFMPWTSPEEFEAEVDNVRAAFRTIPEGGIEELLAKMRQRSESASREERFRAEESTESIQLPGDLLN